MGRRLFLKRGGLAGVGLVLATKSTLVAVCNSPSGGILKHEEGTFTRFTAWGPAGTSSQSEASAQSNARSAAGGNQGAPNYITETSNNDETCVDGHVSPDPQWVGTATNVGWDYQWSCSVGGTTTWVSGAQLATRDTNPYTAQARRKGTQTKKWRNHTHQ